MGRSATERIDGWKSIAAHLGRDRSTVIRWAKERSLPVHALPGGRSRSVYALRSELDAWVRGRTPDELGIMDESSSAEAAVCPAQRPTLFIDRLMPNAGAAEGGWERVEPSTYCTIPDQSPCSPANASGADGTIVQTDPSPTRSRPGHFDVIMGSAVEPAETEPVEMPSQTIVARGAGVEASATLGNGRRGWILGAGGGVITLVALAALASTGAIERARSAPAVSLDALAQARFVQARDDVAIRSETRLSAALPMLSALASRHPQHAAIQEALAEAWLLAREFGSVSDAVAFDHARRAAMAARRLDPKSAVADRVEGATAYWWDRDPERAGAAFRRALAAAPRDALTHLWYANILADNGEDQAAEREFLQARTITPGATYMLVDHAWGLWSAGRETEAVVQLNALARDSDLASVPDCLSVIALSRGDVAGYARHLAERAARRRSSELTAYSGAVDEALALGGERGGAAAYAVMLSRALSLAENAARPDHSWSAFIASVAGDRTQLLAILREADARNERWGAAGFVRRIRARWRSDGMISQQLDGLTQSAIEPAKSG